MGQVWLADQLEPVRRQVAVKVIKAGMDTKQVIARFESERQALALMNHPAIARVFDGGSTTEGRPYFVMEYVAGIDIADHCDTHKLSTAARLGLLCEVCAGVQHAHQKAVIHRDLKPSNILVSMVDGKAQPKIIDFGIAKATGSPPGFRRRTTFASAPRPGRRGSTRCPPSVSSPRAVSPVRRRGQCLQAVTAGRRIRSLSCKNLQLVVRIGAARSTTR